MFNINNNTPTPNELNNNEILFSDISQNVILNCINSDFNNFAKNENEVNNLKYPININYINNINYNLIINTDMKKDNYKIVELLKNNPNIESYKDTIDFLSFEDLLKMFSFILNNEITFISNSQSYIIINKVISLYNSSFHDSNKNKNDNSKNNMRENIFAFLLTFFSKNIIYLINSNYYITTILFLVQTFGYPKNDFIFSEIKHDFHSFCNTRPGCILIQNIFPLGNQIQQQDLLNEIMAHYNELIVDKYGHYIFKYLLYKVEHGEKYYTLIFNKIVNNLKKYASNKYSSVIIERLLDSSNEDIKNKIIKLVCDNEKDIIELLYHAYGNYVLQKIINISKDKSILGLIYKTVMKNKNSMYKLSYGKKIMKEISIAYTLK